MNVPNWWEFLLLALAGFRIWKLIADDTILDRPREFVLQKIKEERAEYWQAFITCPWCAGFWIFVIWWGLWEGFGHPVLVVASLFAGHAVVGWLGTLWYSLTE